MPKSAAERKAAQCARQNAAGERKLELVLDEQELAMVEQNCAARRPGRWCGQICRRCASNEARPHNLPYERYVNSHIDSMASQEAFFSTADHQNSRPAYT